MEIYGNLAYVPPKVFEKIADDGASARGTNELWSMDELVKLVEKHPKYGGTSWIYEHKLWSLIDKESISQPEILALIDEALAGNGLKRCSPEVIKGYQSVNNFVGFSPRFYEVFRQSTENLPALTVAYLEFLYYLLEKTGGFLKLTAGEDQLAHSERLNRYFIQELSELDGKIKDSDDESPYLDVISRISAIRIELVGERGKFAKSVPKEFAWPICRIGEPLPVVDPIKLPMGVDVTGLRPI